MSDARQDDWDERVDRFWASASEDESEQALALMRELVEERPGDDAAAMYEWASVHVFLGREREAVPLYRAALAAGLAGPRRPQAVVQLANSLRNVGDAAAAVELLAIAPPDPAVGAARDAFLALALHDAGRHDEALRVALLALAPHLPRYTGAVREYAAALTG